MTDCLIVQGLFAGIASCIWKQSIQSQPLLPCSIRLKKVRIHGGSSIIEYKLNQRKSNIIFWLFHLYCTKNTAIPLHNSVGGCENALFCANSFEVHSYLNFTGVAQPPMSQTETQSCSSGHRTGETNTRDRNLTWCFVLLNRVLTPHCYWLRVTHPLPKG